MKIETKFDIGEKVYFKVQYETYHTCETCGQEDFDKPDKVVSEIKSGTVCDVNIGVGVDKEIYIDYCLTDDSWYNIKESCLFSSQEEVQASIDSQ